MTEGVELGLIRDLGEGRWLRVSSAPQGGWWLFLMEGGEMIARARLKPDDYRRVSHGKVATEGEVEIRGMRAGVEFRVAGRILGRLEKTSFIELIEAAGSGQ